jgi:predicted PurR-regulated permease PerM
MKDFFKSRMAQSILPYLVLAVGAIIAWNVISEFGLFIAFVRRAWFVITPFFYGFILAYIINIPCSAIQRLYGNSKNKFISKRRNGLGVITVYILFVALIALVLSFLIPAIGRSAAHFIDELPDYYEQALEFLYDFEALEFLNIYINYQGTEELPEGVIHWETADIEGFLWENMQRFAQRFNLDNAWSSLVTVFGSAFSLLFNTFLAFISSIFYLLEKEKASEFVCRFFKAFTSSGVFNFIIKYSRQLNKNFKQYIYTQTIDGIILGTVATLLLAFVIRSPYALILGLMLGIINYIPYFGSIFGSLIAVIVVAFTQGIGMGAFAAVIMLVMQQLDGNVLQPKLMGSSFKMSPLIIIVSVTIGAQWGILGMLAAIPIVAVLKDILDNLIIYFEQKKHNKAEEVSD